MSDYPAFVRIVEVGPRDGLQSEATVVDTATKVAFVDRLSLTGLSTIEVASFVSAETVPQLADAEAVFAAIQRHQGISYSALAPNLTGLERALAAGASEVAIFAAASETFSHKNINCGIDESFRRFDPVLRRAHAQGLPVRAYLSCVLGCPYEGDVDMKRVVSLSHRLVEMGCYEVSLADTIGVGTPLAARALVEEVAAIVAVQQLAVHFHDTRGQALANVLACLELGVSVVDAAVAGLGGCPFAPGSAGNLATEDLAYMLQGMKIDTGVSLDAIIGAGEFICQRLGRETRSRVGSAGVFVTTRPSDPSRSLTAG